MLKDALLEYEGPYGFVAKMDKHRYERCECVDQKTQVPKKHFPCNIASVIIIKVIYTETEARRRGEEDEKIVANFEATWSAVDAWLQEKLGRRMQAEELQRRQRRMTHTAKKKDEELQKENTRLQVVQEGIEMARQRVTNFYNDEPANFHHIATAEEAEAVMEEAEKALAGKLKDVERIQTELKELKESIALPLKQQIERAVRDLRQKYAHLGRERIIDASRRLARKRNWRRPWDGADGAEFRGWLERNRAGLTVEDEKGTPYVSLPDWMQAFLTEQSEIIEQGGWTDSEFNWHGTDNMELFTTELIPVYSEWETKKLLELAEAELAKKKKKRR